MTMDRKHMKRRDRLETVRAICLLLCLILATSAQANDIVGFTEPVKTIKLAASETGILAKLHVKRGDDVSAGQTVAALDTDVLKTRRALAEARVQSTARLKSAKIKVTRAEHNFQQLQQLHDEGHGGKRELELAASDLELARTDLEAVEDEELLNRLDIDRIDAEIRRRTVISPISGIVTEVHREVGEFVATTEPTVVTIADLSELRVRFYPNSDAAEALQTGDAIAIRALHSGQVLNAKIDFIAPLIDADSNTIQVDVLLDNRRGRLRSGRRCILLLDHHTPAPQPRLTKREGVRR
jgi:RND family efflux transporter MFP subunit